MTNKEQLIHHIDNSCRYLRLGIEGRANKELTSVFDSFLTLDTWLAHETIIKITPLLTPMYQAQQRGDVIYLADILEYEVKPLLE